MNPTSLLIAALTGLITGLIGLALGRISERLKNVDERRRKVSKALCELLELHHGLRAYQRTLQLCKDRFKKIGVPEFQIRQVIFSMGIQFDAALGPRYDNAVTQLAEVEPVLAFRLRNKHQIHDWLKLANSFPLQTAQDQKLFMSAESQILDMFLPHLREHVATLAKHLNFSVKRDIRAMLEDSSDPPELEALLAQIDSAIATAQNTLPAQSDAKKN